MTPSSAAAVSAEERAGVARNNRHPRSRRTHRKRSRIAAVAAFVVLAMAAVIGAAWLSAPATSNFAQRVRANARSRSTLTLWTISPLLRQAVVATEDERFFRHHGIDIIGILRAIPYDVTHVSLSEGASTITEQLAKRLYLNGNDHSPWRKLEDAILALRIERAHTKEQILAAYLETAYFGHGANGITAAARRYFDRAPRDLTLAQASLLAGVIQAPSAYDPVLHPVAARERQVEVLRSMVRNGDITVAEGSAALATPLALRRAQPLPPLRDAALASGSAFVWTDVGAAAALVILGGATFVLRRFFRHRIMAVVLATTFVAAGTLTFARSFRTL